MLDHAETAITVLGDVQWALELSTDVLRGQPDNPRAQKIRLESLRALAAAADNIRARYFYLTMILDDRKLVDWNMDPGSLTELADAQTLLNLMKTQVKAEIAAGVDATVYMHFADNDSTFRLQVSERN